MAFFGGFLDLHGFWMQYFRMVPLLSELAPFLDLRGFLQYFSEGVFGFARVFWIWVYGGCDGVMVWRCENIGECDIIQNIHFYTTKELENYFYKNSTILKNHNYHLGVKINIFLIHYLKRIVLLDEIYLLGFLSEHGHQVY
jgi:hypothetical protein